MLDFSALFMSCDTCLDNDGYFISQLYQFDKRSMYSYKLKYFVAKKRRKKATKNVRSGKLDYSGAL